MPLVSGDCNSNLSNMQGDQNDVQHAARSLVCDRCWHDLFNTKAFQRLCLFDKRRSKIGSWYSQHEVSVRQISVRQIHESAVKGCNWCNFIQTCIEGTQIDYPLDIYLIPTRTAATPMGNNTF